MHIGRVLQTVVYRSIWPYLAIGVALALAGLVLVAAHVRGETARDLTLVGGPVIALAGVLQPYELVVGEYGLRVKGLLYGRAVAYTDVGRVAYVPTGALLVGTRAELIVVPYHVDPASRRELGMTIARAAGLAIRPHHSGFEATR